MPCYSSTTAPATTDIYTLSLHDALPISPPGPGGPGRRGAVSDHVGHRGHLARDAAHVDHGEGGVLRVDERSEEHTSELQSRRDLVCRLLLEKKKRIATFGSSSPDTTTPP